MTKEEFTKNITQADARLRGAEAAIVSFARVLVPTLRDRGCEHSAKELERLLFIFDQEIGEARSLMESGLEHFIRGLRDFPGGGS